MANAFEEIVEMVEARPELDAESIKRLVRDYMAREWAAAERDVLDPNLEAEEEVSRALEGVEELSLRIRSGFVDRVGLAQALGDGVPLDGTLELQRVSQAILRAQREVQRMRAAMFSGRYDEAVPRDLLFADLRPRYKADPAGATISQLLDRWLTERKPKPRSKLEWETAVRRWIELFGDTDVRAVDKHMVVKFKDALVRLPSAPKGELYGLPIPELLERAPEDWPRLSPASVNKQLAAIKRLLSYAAENALIETSPAAGLKLAEKKGSGKPRVPLSTVDIATVTSGPVHTKGARPKGGAGELAYWAIPLGLFTGMRLGEIGQLQVGDVRDESGVWVIDVNDDGPEKSLKTSGSRRRVPLHPALVAMGFLGYIDKRRDTSDPDAPLWPDLNPDCKGRLTGNFSKWMNRYMRRCGVAGAGKAFHSTRHTFKDRARDAGMPEEVSDAITGHANGSVGRAYGNGVPIKVLAEWMAKVEYPGLGPSAAG